MKKNRKRICVLGLGQFGRELAINCALEAEVLAIDENQMRVNEIAETVQHAVALDVADYSALSSIVNTNFDEGIVCLSENMEASILSVMHLKKIGVKRVHAKARNNDHAQVLEAVGANFIIFPERDTARRLAHQMLNPDLLDLMPLEGDYSIVHFKPPADFYNKNLQELDLRRQIGIFVIALKKDIPPQTIFLPGPEAVITEDSVMIVIGSGNAINAMRKFTS